MYTALQTNKNKQKVFNLKKSVTINMEYLKTISHISVSIAWKKLKLIKMIIISFFIVNNNPFLYKTYTFIVYKFKKQKR